MASSIANRATTVFPVPTSPISKRCIRSGASMSSVISRIACRWSPVSSNGRCVLSLVVSAFFKAKLIPARARLASARARACTSCWSNSSSNASRRRPASASAGVAGRRTLEGPTAAVVAEDRPEYPESLAGGEHPRAHDAADARRLLAHLHLVQGRDRRGVEIPMGGVVQQVPDAPDTEPCKRLRTLRPHALQVLHRCSELEGHPPMSLRANRSAANTSRSPRPSPVPRKRIGTCTARSEEHTSELQSQSNLVCRLLLEKKKKT